MERLEMLPAENGDHLKQQRLLNVHAFFPKYPTPLEVVHSYSL